MVVQTPQDIKQWKSLKTLLQERIHRANTLRQNPFYFVVAPETNFLFWPSESEIFELFNDMFTLSRTMRIKLAECPFNYVCQASPWSRIESPKSGIYGTALRSRSTNLVVRKYIPLQTNHSEHDYKPNRGCCGVPKLPDLSFWAMSLDLRVLRTLIHARQVSQYTCASCQLHTKNKETKECLLQDTSADYNARFYELRNLKICIAIICQQSIATDLVNCVLCFPIY